jgi:sensor histidine kinase YesM
MRSKALRHILFWLVFFGISLYNDLYLSVSFTLHPSLELVVQTACSLALLYIVKITVVYLFLYRLIPHWVDARSKRIYYIQGIALLLVGALLIRLATQQVIWRFTYDGELPKLAGKQLIARYFYSLLDLLQITAIAIAIKLFRMRVRAIEKEKKLVKEKLEAEMQHLRSQTNPHFLFNTLNSIFSLSRSKSEQTSDAVLKLSKILRYMLYETSHATKTIQDELNVVNDYVQLQELRFGDRIRLEIKKDIDDVNEPIAPLLLLPLIENAYKHSNQAEALIRVELKLERSQLRLQVENPVAGISVPDDSQQGIGIGNIRRQLELLYRDFNFTHVEKNGIFIVTLEIDLSSYAKTELFDTGR